MDNKPLISVIVPIYMIERYIGICIESIIKQTYKNLEIILVDDGSKDKCPEICDLYARKDSRIKVIHNSNGGLVSARKSGLRESNGRYITYVDGDDWIEPDFIESLYESASKYDADMVCAGFTRVLFSRSARFINNLQTGVYEKDDLKKLWRTMASLAPYYKNGISTYVWNKLFRREILLDSQNMVDNRITLGEDGAVTYPALLKCKKVVVIENVAYHYRQREDSMLKKNTGYCEDAKKLQYLYDYLKNWARTTDSNLKIESQVIDYVLSIALIRSGGRLPDDDYSTFDKAYYNKDVVIFSAGTFGQQLVNRFKETRHCNIVGWVDDDYWEYRRCCLNVDPVERIVEMKYDFVLVATVDAGIADNVESRLCNLGVRGEKILKVTAPEDKEQLLKRFLDVESIKNEEKQRSGGLTSHA